MGDRAGRGSIGRVDAVDAHTVDGPLRPPPDDADEAARPRTRQGSSGTGHVGAIGLGRVGAITRTREVAPYVTRGPGAGANHEATEPTQGEAAPGDDEAMRAAAAAILASAARAHTEATIPASPARAHAEAAILAGAQTARAGGAALARATAPAGRRVGPDGFSAPAPAAWDRELPHNRTGWLVGVGAANARLFPRTARLAPLALMWVPMAAVELVAALLPGAPRSLPPPLPSFFMASCAVGLSALYGVHKLAGALTLSLQQRRARRAERITDLAVGQIARIKGTVVPQATIPSLFAGRPAVVTRNRVGLAEETRAIDFTIETPAGERVRVRARGVFLLDRPQPLPDDEQASGPVGMDFVDRTLRLRPYLPTNVPLSHRLWTPHLREVALGPGDKVEVCGLLEREAAPAGDAPPGRGTPLQWSLREGKGVRLCVRRAR